MLELTSLFRSLDERNFLVQVCGKASWFDLFIERLNLAEFSLHYLTLAIKRFHKGNKK